MDNKQKIKMDNYNSQINNHKITHILKQQRIYVIIKKENRPFYENLLTRRW